MCYLASPLKCHDWPSGPSRRKPSNTGYPRIVTERHRDHFSVSFNKSLDACLCQTTNRIHIAIQRALRRSGHRVPGAVSDDKTPSISDRKVPNIFRQRSRLPQITAGETQPYYWRLKNCHPCLLEKAANCSTDQVWAGTCWYMHL